MLAQPLLLSLIPLLPIGQAIDPEAPPPTSAANERAPEAPRPMPGPSVPPSSGEFRDSALYYVAALGGPTGIAGVEGVRRVGSIFEVSGGIGIGFGAADAPHARADQVLQWAVMPRLRLGNDRSAFTAGAGVSGGDYARVDLCIADSCGSDGVSYFLWSNLEIGWERWGESGFARRVFLGWAHGWCVSATCVSAATNLPYFGFGLGYAF